MDLSSNQHLFQGEPLAHRLQLTGTACFNMDMRNTMVAA